MKRSRGSKRDRQKQTAAIAAATRDAYEIASGWIWSRTQSVVANRAVDRKPSLIGRREVGSYWAMRRGPLVLLYMDEGNFLRCCAMKTILSVVALGAAVAVAFAADQPAKVKIDPAQIPKWSAEDLDFFLHGSMSTEVVPEKVLRAFIKMYPDLFPAADLTYLGLLPDPAFGWPIGISRKAEVKHLGGLSAVGINCASCHVAEIRSPALKEPLRILGATSHFN